MDEGNDESEVSSAKKKKKKTHNNDNEEHSGNESGHAERNRIQHKEMEYKSNESTIEMDQEGVASPDSGNGSEHEANMTKGSQNTLNEEGRSITDMEDEINSTEAKINQLKREIEEKNKQIKDNKLQMSTHVNSTVLQEPKDVVNQEHHNTNMEQQPMFSKGEDEGSEDVHVIGEFVIVNGESDKENQQCESGKKDKNVKELLLPD